MRGERKRAEDLCVDVFLSQRYLTEEGGATDEHTSSTETGLSAILW